MAGYYYGQLSKEKKAVYDMLAAGCDALAAVIRVPDLGTEVLSDIYLRMKLDLPLLFFVTGFHYRKMPGERVTGRRSWPSTISFWRTSPMTS